MNTLLRHFYPFERFGDEFKVADSVRRVRVGIYYEIYARANHAIKILVA